jgi:hypothetical protein
MMAGGGKSMLAATRTWLDGLRDFAVEHRRRKPLSAPDAEGERNAERMILAAHLATVLAGWEQILAARREAGGGVAESDADPAVVITTSPVGIAVAADQFDSGSLPARALVGRAVAVTELEYRLWCIRQSDDGYRRHVNVWNWIKTSVPLQRHAEFARNPLQEGEAYWLHRAGIAGAGGADRRDCHLWKWNGRHASLLQAFVAERGVSELS